MHSFFQIASIHPKIKQCKNHYQFILLLHHILLISINILKWSMLMKYVVVYVVFNFYIMISFMKYQFVLKEEMKERKVWNSYEDKILRYLKQQKGQKKWSVIAKKMEEEYQIAGRTGKQCRQRYHNHLDSSIVSSGWTNQEDQILIILHQQYGNKWSSISQNLPGRSDNCVKNRFYSKLRKSVRRLNKFILEHLSQEYQSISPKLLSKIIETTEQRSRNNYKIEEEAIDYSIDIKNRLFSLQNFIKGDYIQSTQEIELAKPLIDDIFFFQKNAKKPGKVIRKRTDSFEEKDNFLHPKMCIKMNRSNSNASSYSQNSEEMSSLLSSSNLSSSSSFYDDIEEDDKNDKTRHRSYTTRSTKEMKSRNNSDLMVSKNQEIKSNGEPKLDNKQTRCQFYQPNFGWIQNQKLSMSLIEDYPSNSEKKARNHRNSSASNKSSSNKSNSSKMFPNFDPFGELNQKFLCNLNFEQPLSQIIWRIIQPKQKDKFDRILQEDDPIILGQFMEQEG